LGLRKYLKGWGANKGNRARELKAQILAQINDLDSRADSSGFDEEDWAFRYYLEDELMNILSGKEEYWRQRGHQNWILQGDANMAYFHAIANGRRRKCVIRSLTSEEGEISGHQAIQDHVYKFYVELMGCEEPKFLNLGTNCWAEKEIVSREKNEALALSFTMEEL
jgi:hypothetical protein